jgi:hypothetical protein
LKLESHLMSAIGEKFEAYTAICCDFNRATMQQQISYAYHADIVSIILRDSPVILINSNVMHVCLCVCVCVCVCVSVCVCLCLV